MTGRGGGGGFITIEQRKGFACYLHCLEGWGALIFPHRPDNDKFLKCVSSEAENFRGLGLLKDVGGRKTRKQILSFYNTNIY